jgi:hypothetical protein
MDLLNIVDHLQATALLKANTQLIIIGSYHNFKDKNLLETVNIDPHSQ